MEIAHRLGSSRITHERTNMKHAIRVAISMTGDVSFTNLVLLDELLSMDKRVQVVVHLREPSEYASSYMRHFPKVTRWETTWLANFGGSGCANDPPHEV
jgi:hypothetical protein